jgi:prolyl 4-hydroxylase
MGDTVSNSMSSAPTGEPEKEVRTDLSRCLKGSAPVLVDDERFQGYEIFLLKELFSKEESEALVYETEKLGFGATSYAKEYRGNLRLICFDAALAEHVWQRVKPFMPDRLSENGRVYEVQGLNTCWRVSKYLPGDQFKNHVDTYFREADGDTEVKSLFTLNIYMNGEESFTGGNTVFHLFGAREEEERKHHACYPEDLDDDDPGIHCIQRCVTVTSVTPETGLGLIFRQPPGARYVHEGEAVTSGLKYLIRTDVMYKSLGDYTATPAALL